jgi:uncharacterized membrane protein YbhN (UPF0104 family)
MERSSGEVGAEAPVVPEHRFSRPGWRVLVTALVAVISVGLLLWVAPPGQVLKQIGDMKLSWVLVAIGLELGSCASYPVVFRRFFPEPPAGVSRQVAWMAMGAGALLPGGNIASAGATGILLRRHGVATRRLIERCAALLCLLTLFGFLVNGVAGALLLAQVPGGPHDLLHTGGPILVSIIVLGTATLIVLAGRRRGLSAPRVLRGVAGALEGAWRETGTGHWRLLGGAGFLLLDMGALWASCAATGHPLGFLAIILAYCIGYLATLIPVPAGIGVLDTGLAGTLVLYHFPATSAVGAVLVYHAISIWVPAVGGLIAWLPTQRRRTGESAAVGLPSLHGIQLAAAADRDG